jgi:ADP-ribose pyrophosphatase YjhB (NUDIX family)
VSDHPFSRAEFDSIFNRVPRLTVEILARNAGGILLTERAIEPCKGMWHIPGGTVRIRETLADAVIRVAKDELNLDVKPGEFLGYMEYPKLSASGYSGWPVGLVFEADIIGGEPKGGEQGRKIGYFTEIPENMVPDQADFLREHVL